MLPPIDDQTSTYEPTVYCGHPKSSYDCSNMFKACWENIQIYIYIHHTIIHIKYNQSDWPTKKSRMLWKMNDWLVVQCAHLEKYEFVNGKDDIPYIMEHKTCSKPPTG